MNFKTVKDGTKFIMNSFFPIFDTEDGGKYFALLKAGLRVAPFYPRPPPSAHIMGYFRQLGQIDNVIIKTKFN